MEAKLLAALPVQLLHTDQTVHNGDALAVLAYAGNKTEETEFFFNRINELVKMYEI